MSAQIVKKLSSPYLIVATKSNPTVLTVGKADSNNAELIVNGDLTVLGKQTTISTTDTNIFDNTVTLNSGLLPTASPIGLMSGFVVNRGAGDENSVGGFSGNAELRWNESIHHWELTNDGGTSFNRIATIGAGKVYISDIVEDLTPQLGGNLDTNGSTITSTYGNNVIIDPANTLQVNRPLQLAAVPPLTATVDNFSILAGGAIDGGGTGVYVTNSNQINQELISKKKAILYSLIF